MARIIILTLLIMTMTYFVSWAVSVISGVSHAHPTPGKLLKLFLERLRKHRHQEKSFTEVIDDFENNLKNREETIESGSKEFSDDVNEKNQELYKKYKKEWFDTYSTSRGLTDFSSKPHRRLADEASSDHKNITLDDVIRLGVSMSYVKKLEEATTTKD